MKTWNTAQHQKQTLENTVPGDAYAQRCCSGLCYPFFPAFSLILCWTLVAMGCSWLNHKAQCVFGSVHTDTCVHLHLWCMPRSHLSSPLCVPAHAQQYFLQQRTCREQKCRYLKWLGVDIQAEPVEMSLCLCVCYVWVCAFPGAQKNDKRWSQHIPDFFLLCSDHTGGRINLWQL